mmetsp:Transcript_14469/g.27588  ORF Transcript_14469/g.27588 Transcript_14469/m.27588 type:complete len:99 (+) Transcript_14469:446-742(+)
MKDLPLFSPTPQISFGDGGELVLCSPRLMTLDLTADVAGHRHPDTISCRKESSGGAGRSDLDDDECFGAKMAFTDDEGASTAFPLISALPVIAAEELR